MTLRAVSSSVPPGRQAPYILAQSAVPVCLAPNGTVATNGIVTLGTALPTTYSGGIWLRLPANAIVGGLAGLYWAVMSSTTQGQVYTNFADPATEFIPSIPSGSLVAAVGSNAAYTQTTSSDITLANIKLVALVMGLSGSLNTQPQWSHPNNANNKLEKVTIGGVICASWTNTTTLTESRPHKLRNKGVYNRQLDSTFIGLVSSTSSFAYRTIDTSVQQPILLIAQLAVATDYVVLDGFDIVVSPS